MSTPDRATTTTPNGALPVGNQLTGHSNYGDLLLSAGDYHPPRGTISDVVQLILDQAASNLLNARRLAGQSSGIPTWEMLMAVWRRYGKAQPKAERVTQTDPVTRPTLPDDGRALARWATAATPEEVMKHPLIQTAIYRGIVAPRAKPMVPRKSSGRPSSVRPRVVSTKPDLKQAMQVQKEPNVVDLTNLDSEEEEFLQLQVGP